MSTTTETATTIARDAVPTVETIGRLNVRDGSTGEIVARASRELAIGGLRVETTGYAHRDGTIAGAVRAVADEVTFVSVADYTFGGIGVTLSNLTDHATVVGRMSLEKARELRADLDAAIARAEAKA